MFSKNFEIFLTNNNKTILFQTRRLSSTSTAHSATHNLHIRLCPIRLLVFTVTPFQIKTVLKIEKRERGKERITMTRQTMADGIIGSRRRRIKR